MNLNASRAAGRASRGGQVGLHVVLRRLQTELERLRYLVADVEDAFGAAEASPVRAEDLRRLQGLDALTQQLSALSTVCCRLADHVPVSATVDLHQVCDGIGLQDVVDRLKGVQPAAPASDGGAELF